MKMKTRDFFSDIGMGIGMMLKGKFSLLPHRIKGSADIKSIFRKSVEAGRQ